MSSPPFKTYKEAYLYKIEELVDKVISKNRLMKTSYFHDGDRGSWCHGSSFDRQHYQTTFIDYLSANRDHYLKVLDTQPEYELRELKTSLENDLRGYELNYDSSLGGLVTLSEGDSWDNVSESDFQDYMDELRSVYGEEYEWKITSFINRLGDGTLFLNLPSAKTHYNDFAEFKEVTLSKAYEPSYMGRTIEYLIKGEYSDDPTGLAIAIQLVLGFTGLDAPMDARDLTANLQKGEYGQALLSGIGLLPIVGNLKNLKFLDDAGELSKVASKQGAHVLEQLKYFANNADEFKEAFSNSAEFKKVLLQLKEAGGDVARKADPSLFDELSVLPENVDGILKLLDSSEELAIIAKRIENVQNGKIANIDELGDILNKPIMEVTDEMLPEGYAFYYTANKQKKIRRTKGSAENSVFARLTVRNNKIELWEGANRVSQSGKLRRMLLNKYASQLDNIDLSFHEAHHIVPDAVVRDHPLFQLARKLDSQPYDIDNLDNGVMLAKTGYSKIEGISEGLPFHSGSHPVYNDLANKVANDEWDALMLGFESIDDLLDHPEEILEATERVQKILLNKLHNIIGKLE
ncbi:AHH domain-containing protein [Spirochaeta cellobiosiphila]|uniref:AHH domain-containing protein n=1 Tax=Spirochaeta cellobiosiphila TaxID=504483 RepID=UPI00040F8AE2|nr:AHH domain-containing protein [Spirochaeta cellobiosiphila]